MNSLPVELLRIIAAFCRPKDRQFLAQVNSHFNKYSIENTTKSIKKAIIDGDIYSLIRLKNDKKFLNTAQLRDYALDLVIETPNNMILMFLLKRCRAIIRYNQIYKIYFNQYLSTKHHKMTQRFIEYTLLNQGKSGMAQSALLYNSTVNSIFNDDTFLSCNLKIACSNGCIRSIQSMLLYDRARVRIFNCIEELLVICAFFNNIKIMKLILKYALSHIAIGLMKENVKRALLVAVSCGRLNVLQILEEICPLNEAYSAICYEDAKYYYNYDLLIIENLGEINPNIITILSILVLKNDKTIEAILGDLQAHNDDESISSLIGELLCLSTKLNRLEVSLILISAIKLPSAINNTIMKTILSNIMDTCAIDIMNAILPMTIGMECEKQFSKEYLKLKKAII